MRFWLDMTKAAVVNPTDKLMLGVNATGETQYIDVSQISVDTSQFVKKTGGNSIDGNQAFTGDVTAKSITIPGTGQITAYTGNFGGINLQFAVIINNSGNVAVSLGNANILKFNGSGVINVTQVSGGTGNPLFMINAGAYDVNIVHDNVHFILPGAQNITIKPKCSLSLIGDGNAGDGNGLYRPMYLGTGSEANFTQALKDKLDGIPADIGDQLDTEVDNRQTADNSLAGLISQETTNRQGGDATNAAAISTHAGNTSNPHHVTLEQARTQNAQLGGDIDANTHQINNLANPSANQQASTKKYTDDAKAAAMSYADSLTVSAFHVAGGWDASTGTFPTTGTGTAGAIRSGDQYTVTVAGTIAGIAFDLNDVFYALINTPGQTSANWQVLEHNISQATESARGTAMVADAVTVANENTLDDSKFITAKKLWLNFYTRVTALSWVWQLKQTFTAAPRFSSAGPSQYLKTDANRELTSVSVIPGTDIGAATQSAQGAAALASTSEATAGTNDTKIMTPAKVGAVVSAEATLRSSADATEAQARSDADTVLSGQIGAASTAITTHIADTGNPHGTTLEQARTANPQIAGDIDANGHQINNLANPSSNQQAATKNYADANLLAAKSYADSLVTSAIRIAGTVDASTGLFPTVGTGTAGAVRSGDQYTVTVAGTINGVQLDVDDTIYALINAPGQTAANWHGSEHNINQATETTRGTAMIVDAATLATETSLEDTKYITTKKIWGSFWSRVIALNWTWAAKQIFTTSPRFSSVTANQYIKVDANKDVASVGAIPATDITDDATHRFTNDTAITKLGSIATGATANSAASSAETTAGADAAKFVTPSGLAGSDYLDQTGSKLKVPIANSGANAFTGNLSPAITAYVDGMIVWVKPTTSNTGPATLALNSLTAIPITMNGDLAATYALRGAELTAGVYTALMYNSNRGTFQIVANGNSIATDAETQITAAVTEDFRIVTRLKLFNWFANIKTLSIVFTNRIKALYFNVTPATNPATVVDGDIWYNSDLYFRDGTFTNKIVKVQNNSSFTGTTNRMLSADTTGGFAAANDIVEGIISDVDVIAAITGATYNQANGYKASIVPANAKTAYAGQIYQTGTFIYFVVLDNTIFRVAASGTLPVVEITNAMLSTIGGAANSYQLSVNTRYINSTTVLSNLIMQTTAVQGDRYVIDGKGTGLFKVSQNAGQTIYYNTVNTTAGTTGYMQSTQKNNVIELTNITANNEFIVEYIVGTFNFN